MSLVVAHSNYCFQQLVYSFRNILNWNKSLKSDFIPTKEFSFIDIYLELFKHQYKYPNVEVLFYKSNGLKVVSNMWNIDDTLLCN